MAICNTIKVPPYASASLASPYSIYPPLIAEYKSFCFSTSFHDENRRFSAALKGMAVLYFTNNVALESNIAIALF